MELDRGHLHNPPCPAREHHQTSISAVCPGLGYLCRPRGAERRCSLVAGVVGRPWLSWRLLMVTECHLENVGQGPLQPLSRRRPFIRRKTIRNKPNIGARQPRVRSATCWLLAVQLKVTSMASDMGSLASHSHVLGSTYHRETLSPILHQADSRGLQVNQI